jgi:hypothetical protein
MPLSDETLDTLVDLAQDHAEILRQLRAAIEAGDEQRAWALAREACGLEESET